jgi:hypothetical protein
MGWNIGVREYIVYRAYCGEVWFFADHTTQRCSDGEFPERSNRADAEEDARKHYKMHEKNRSEYQESIEDKDV